MPLHIKPVSGSVRYEALKSLQVSNQELSKRLSHVLNWVENPDWYAQFKLPSYRKYRSRLSETDMELLEKADKFTCQKPRCGVKAFAVPERSKNRRRPIFWPDINKSIDRSILLRDYIPLRRNVRKKVHDSVWSVQFDFASWYDQLPLMQDIPRLFSVDGKKCLASLPMGFRPSAEVAHTISEVIADFPLPDGVNSVVYIDNVRFGGPNKDSVAQAARDFIARADQVGAVLNDRRITPTRLEDFLGERFDLQKKTRRLTRKTLEKIHAARTALNETVTFRQVAAIFGLLFFCSEVLKLNLSKVFQALRYYRIQMSKVTNWDADAERIPDNALAEIRAWLNAANRNKAVPTWESEEFFPDLTIFVDASSQGWGAVSISSSGIHQAGAPWSPLERSQHDVTHSTVAEPLAVLHAARAFVSTHSKKVKIMSDHQGLVFAGNAGYGKSEKYNRMCLELSESYPATRFVFCFIEGVNNVLADAISRSWGKSAIQPTVSNRLG